MQLSSKHLKQLRKAYAAGPLRWGGGGAGGYLEDLEGATGLRAGDLGVSAEAPLERWKLREMGRAGDHEPLVLYALLMAWGEEDRKKFRESLAEGSRERVADLVRWLRETPTTRLQAFQEAQKRAHRIKGLGISACTALLHFLRPEPDAYILDAGTAQSTVLLCPEAGLRLGRQGQPAPDTPASAYLNFCIFVEQLAAEWGGEWTPEAVEEALSGKVSEDWRKHLERWLPTGPPLVTKTASQHPSRMQELALRISDYHARNPRNLPLPSPRALVTQSSPVRVKCRTKYYLTWHYAVQKSSVHAEIFMLEQRSADYRALCQKFGAPDGDFGHGIHGPPPGTTVNATIRKTIPEGSNRDRSHYDEIAAKAVQAMSLLYETFGEFEE